MRVRMLAISLMLMFGACSAYALDASGHRYVEMLTSGGPGTISRAAQDVFNTGSSDQEVLDVAAQVLSDIYLKNPETREYADATAWLCKALGNSGKGRYKSLIEKVADGGVHRNTRSHCTKAAANLPAGAADAFQPGSVDLAKYRAGGGSQHADRKSVAKAAVAPTRRGKVDLSKVKEGMSTEEVNDLLGQPTNQTTYMTGKQFNPFNFGARDVQRTKYLYKGVGHIVFSLKTAYNGVFRVIEIVPDPGETGYP